MNHSLENSIPYEDYLRMKAQTIPPHRMKEFLDSLNGKGTEEMQQFVHSPISVYQQRNHYFYMDSSDVAGSLLELARPITSPLQHPTVSPGMPLDQHHIPVQHVQLRQGHHIDIQQNQQTKTLQQQLEAQSEGQSIGHAITSNSQERRSCPSGLSQPVKKRKFDLPIEDNYTINHTSLQNASATVLALPVQSQQQAYIPLRQELITVDSSQLYGLVPASTSAAGQLPNVESWAIFSAHATCPESQTIMHTSVPQDSCGIVQMGEIPMSTSSIKLEECKDGFEAKKNIPDKTGHVSGTSGFPMQFINVNGNIQIPLSVQTGGRVYQSSKYWDQQVQPQSLQCSPSEPHLRLQNNADFPCTLKPDDGALFWKTWAQIKNADTLKEAENKAPRFGRRKPIIFRDDVLSVPIAELNYGLCLMTKEARKHDGSPYDADMLFYLFLCMQKHMFDNNRIDNIFADLYYSKFLEKLHDVLKGWWPRVNPFGYMISSCIAEEMLWDCKQLGAHSPTTLLFTLMYFNTKYFVLKNVEQHSQLAFSKITKQTRKNPGIGKDKNCTIRFLRLYGQVQSGLKVTEETYVEQLENPDNPLQCPIKLYDFYRFKCPQGARGPTDAFYLVPEPVVAPNSPIWYSAQPVNEEVMEQMLTRILLVKEVQEAHASSRISAY
ncbi:transcriptional regulator QRICH1-like [Ascaphus truei]|uniref:transcriptional regulator QRICH1-like n=1 Tax=Ascaphus truei TaxID=8439 RepID=UPI003F5ABFA0